MIINHLPHTQKYTEVQKLSAKELPSEILETFKEKLYRETLFLKKMQKAAGGEFKWNLLNLYGEAALCNTFF